MASRHGTLLAAALSRQFTATACSVLCSHFQVHSRVLVSQGFYSGSLNASTQWTPLANFLRGCTAKSLRSHQFVISNSRKVHNMILPKTKKFIIWYIICSFDLYIEQRNGSYKQFIFGITSKEKLNLTAK